MHLKMGVTVADLHPLSQPSCAETAKNTISTESTETRRWTNYSVYEIKRRGKDRRGEGIEQVVARQEASGTFPGTMVDKDGH